MKELYTENCFENNKYIKTLTDTDTLTHKMQLITLMSQTRKRKWIKESIKIGSCKIYVYSS